MNGVPALIRKRPYSECIRDDRDLFTRQENGWDKNWLEKTKKKPEANLESGDRVYFVLILKTQSRNHISKHCHYFTLILE